MVCEIIWSQLAIQSYGQNIEYLKENWTRREVERFITSTQMTLLLLQSQPEIGVPTNSRAGIRKTKISKRILLIYRYLPNSNTIELVQFFNTWQHPNKQGSK